MEFLNLGKQLLSLIDALFSAIEKLQHLQDTQASRKRTLDFEEANGAILGIHHVPGNFGQLLTGDTRFSGDHRGIVMKMAKEERKAIEKHERKIHAILAEKDVRVASLVSKILHVKKQVYKTIEKNTEEWTPRSLTKWEL